MKLRQKLLLKLYNKYFHTNLPDPDNDEEVLRWLMDPNSDLSGIDLERLLARIDERLAEIEAEEAAQRGETAEEPEPETEPEEEEAVEAPKTYGLGIEFTRFGTRVFVSVDGVVSSLPGGDMFGDGKIRRLLETLGRPVNEVSEMPMRKFLGRVISRSDEYLEGRELTSIVVLVPPSLTIRQTNALILCLRDFKLERYKVARACTYAAAWFAKESLSSDRDNIIACCFDEAGMNLSDICYSVKTESNNAFFEETCTASLDGFSPSQIQWSIASCILSKVLNEKVMVRPGYWDKAFLWVGMKAQEIMRESLDSLDSKVVELDKEYFLPSTTIFISKDELEEIIQGYVSQLQSIFEKWRNSLLFYKDDKNIEVLVFDQQFEFPLVQELISTAAEMAFPGYEIIVHTGLSPNSGVKCAAWYFDEILREKSKGDTILLVDLLWQDLNLKLSERYSFPFRLELHQRPYRFTAKVYPEREWQQDVALCFLEKPSLGKETLIGAFQVPLNGKDCRTFVLDVDADGYVDMYILDENETPAQHLSLERCYITQDEATLRTVLDTYPVGKLETDKTSIGSIAMKERMEQMGPEFFEEYDGEDFYDQEVFSDDSDDMDATEE